MNSIHRRRRKPRKRSINLRAFKWVLEREATMRVLWPTVPTEISDAQLRSELARTATHRLHAAVATALRAFPHRRTFLP